LGIINELIDNGASLFSRNSLGVYPRYYVKPNHVLSKVFKKAELDITKDHFADFIDTVYEKDVILYDLSLWINSSDVYKYEN
jgi:hypothetical protein